MPAMSAGSSSAGIACAERMFLKDLVLVAALSCRHGGERTHRGLGPDPSGADRVHANPARREFPRQRTCQADHRMLAGDVGGEARYAGEAPDRGLVDDARSRSQQRQQRANGARHAADVVVEQPAPVGLRSCARHRRSVSDIPRRRCSPIRRAGRRRSGSPRAIGPSPASWPRSQVMVATSAAAEKSGLADCSAAASRSTASRRQPCAAKARAMAWPMPRAAPVTMTALPASA